MNRTVWKSIDEIELLLKDYKTISTLSCGTCANLSYTGGTEGIAFFKKILTKLDKEAGFSRCIIGCCPEEIMRAALRTYRKKIVKSDALVILSCAAGIKSAHIADPDFPLPILSVLDSIGSVPILHEEYPGNPVAASVCVACGHCVLSYTGGICPISECPAMKKYGPCSKSPREGTECALDSSRNCIWKEIEKRGNLKKLNDLKMLQSKKDYDRPVLKKPKYNVFPKQRKLISDIVARIQMLEHVINYFK